MIINYTFWEVIKWINFFFRRSKE